MRFVRVALSFGLSLTASSAIAQNAAPAPAAPAQEVLRVCVDPDNLPFSDKEGRGFENRIAAIIGSAWNRRVEFAWWPVRRGFFTRGLNGRYCDVAITAPSQLDMAAVTLPYFRSAYVMVYRKDSGLELTSLDDPALKRLRIGVNLLNADSENTPPAMALSAHGIVGTLVGFGTFYSDSTRPEDIINAVINRTIDVAIVWGPLAGYFAQRSPVPLVLNPILQDTLSGIPFAFDISMAVRRRDRALRDSLQIVLDTHQSEIQAVLREFGVPLLPLSPDTSRGAAGKPPGR